MKQRDSANLSKRKRIGNALHLQGKSTPEGQKAVRFSTRVIQDNQFESVLDRPFHKWNEIEDAIAAYVPEWNHTQRGFVILHLIRFLELKVLLEEYVPGNLLAPTKLVDKAWRALVLETELYQSVTTAIQDFHTQPRHVIHYSLLTDSNDESFKDRLDRTQTLCQNYYKEPLPTSFGSDSDSAILDASALTDPAENWGTIKAPSFNIHSCSDDDGSGDDPVIGRSNIQDPYPRGQPTTTTLACRTLLTELMCCTHAMSLDDATMPDKNSVVSRVSLDHDSSSDGLSPKEVRSSHGVEVMALPKMVGSLKN